MKEVLDRFPITRTISRGAQGADKLSEQYAIEKGIRTEIYIPDWDLFGKKLYF